MFGLVVCNKKELTKEEQERYQGIYCGLCRMLKYKYGQTARFSLNYDMTFLALLLSALYEPEETCGEKRCMIHPLKKRPCVENPYIEYAADMTILLSYFKCQDDWTDEGKKGARIYAKMLEPHLLDLSEKYPRQFETAKKKVEEFAKKVRKGLGWEHKNRTIAKRSSCLLIGCFCRRRRRWTGR